MFSEGLPTLKESASGYLRRYAVGTRHTCRAKRVDLQHFIEFVRSVTECPEPSLGAIEPSFVEQFVEYRLRMGDAPATLARRIATLKHFLRICSEEVQGFSCPVQQVRLPVLPVERPKSLSPDTVEQIVSYLNDFCEKRLSFKAVRDRVLVHTLLSTGLRADEVRILTLNQISADGAWFTDVRTKGRKFRKVYIAESLRARIQEYLPHREEEIRKKLPRLPKSIDKKIPLFVGIRGAHAGDLRSFRLNEKTIWRIVSSTCRAVGVHPHLLRHTFANRLLETTHDIRLVSQALGHSDLRVTMKYTERSDEDVARAIEDHFRAMPENPSRR